MRVISTDPFARTRLERYVAKKWGDCAFCGKKDSKFFYMTVPDSIRTVRISDHGCKVFCSINCWRSYNGL